MASVSLCMIVKNESFFLEKLLIKIKDYVDEIIIVDTGSEDNTKKIAEKFTKNIFDFKWNDNFSDARNFSISKAKKDWILVLDADEIISEKDMKKLKFLLDNIEKREIDSFYLIQKNYTNEETLYAQVNNSKYSNYKFFIPNPIIRLFKNNKKIYYKGIVHEIVDETVENAIFLNISIHHFIDEKNKNSLKERQLKYLHIIEKSIKEKPDGRLYATAGAIYAQYFNDYEKAISYFEKSYGLGYKKEKIKESIADCYALLKNYNKAFSIYNQLIQNNYITISICNNLANFFIMAGHNKEALKILKLALSLEGNKDFIKKRIRQLEK